MMEAVLNSPFGQRMLGFSPMSIGRSPTNQIVLTHDNQVSGTHAEIHPTGQGYTLTDLGSTNGTFVNELRLAPHVPYVLKLQDTIRIGQTPFV
ncbi:MAG: FHA domain-containing protein, partial [Ktedonobacteraceae bacterium]